jgi:hypothetical protein
MKCGLLSLNWMRKERTIQVYLHTHFGKCQIVSYTDDRYVDRFNHIMILLDRNIDTKQILGIELIVSY